MFPCSESEGSRSDFIFQQTDLFNARIKGIVSNFEEEIVSTNCKWTNWNSLQLQCKEKQQLPIFWFDSNNSNCYFITHGFLFKEFFESVSIEYELLFLAKWLVRTIFHLFFHLWFMCIDQLLWMRWSESGFSFWSILQPRIPCRIWLKCWKEHVVCVWMCVKLEYKNVIVD